MSRLSARASMAVFTAFFFCSGAAGLIYEVLWMRQFGLIMGNTTLALSAVLTAFMGGLAIGSWIGGRIADRRSDHLRLYGVLELLIGIYALGVPLLIGATKTVLAPLYQADPNGTALVTVRFILALLIMIVPTIFMGATLPILIKHFTAREEEIGRRVGLIYGINTFGAMAGAFLAGLVLIPQLGMRMTNITGVLINLVIGVLAVILGWQSAQDMLPQASGAADESADAAPTIRPPLPREVTAVLLGIAISGMAAMIYQVCWTRLFALLIGSSVYSFSLVVMANIGGLAIGGVLFGRWIDRSSRPLMYFATLQILVAIICYGIIYFSQHYPLWVLRMLSQHRDNYYAILFYEFAFICFLIFVPTFLMGGMFPIAARICTADVRRLGKTIGSVYAVNTVGAVIGSFTAGLVFLRIFGLWNAVMVAVALNLVAGIIAIVAESRVSAAFRGLAMIPAVLVAALVVVAPSQWKQELMSVGPFYIDRFHEDQIRPQGIKERAREGELIFYEDGLAGTVTVRDYRKGIPNRILAINGKIESSSNTGDMPTQLLCGHLGLLANPPAKSAMLVGLGGGFSLSALTQNETLERIDLVEISESVVKAVRTHFNELTLNALDDPRVNLILGDGRNHLTLTGQTYDIIVNEPSNPWIAGISNLFTKEFFEGCLGRLNEDGVMVQWIHTYNMNYKDFMTVIKTFMEVMPHATLWEANDGDYLMVGAKEPIVFDWNEISQILQRPKIKQQMKVVSLDDPRVLVASFMATKEQISALPDYQNAPLNVDDTCKLEFSAPRGFYDTSGYPTVEQLLSLRFSAVPAFDPASLTPQLREQMENIPKARALIIKGHQTAVNVGYGPAVKLFEEALKMSPYDPLARRRASELYTAMLEDAFQAEQWSETRMWAKRMIDLFDDLDAAVSHWEQGVAYRMLFLSARRLNDQESMDLARNGLLRLGGERYAEVMTEEYPDLKKLTQEEAV